MFIKQIKGMEKCQSCEEGSYSINSGETNPCKQCPSGYKCISTSSSPQVCPIGTYSPSSSTICFG